MLSVRSIDELPCDANATARESMRFRRHSVMKRLRELPIATRLPAPQQGPLLDRLKPPHRTSCSPT
jgi:hypothetical protein